MRSHIPGRRRPWGTLLKAVSELADGKAELLRHVERPWASVTFSGTRHSVSLAFTGADAVVAGEAFLDALPEHEFTIPRQVVVEATAVSIRHDLLPEPRLTAELELLLLEDA